MILRKVSLIFSKYLAILLCLITLLLTTPWGSQLTLLLVNNISGVTFDYHSGSLVRDIKLHSFHLQLDTLDITVKELATEFDFSCVWKRTLCIKSAKADYFSLRYSANNKGKAQISAIEKATEERSNYQLFTMPFSIKADSIELKESYLVINNNEISIDQLMTQLSVNRSEFNFLQPTVKQLTLTRVKNESKTPIANKQSTPSINEIVAQLPELHLPISLNIEQLRVDQIVIATKNDLINNCQLDCQQWRSSNNQLSGTWIGTDISISQFQTTTPTFSISQFTAEGTLIPPYTVNSHLVSQLNDITWWSQVANTSQKIALQGSLEALTFSVISKGDLALESQGQINLVHADMPFNITINAEKIPTPYALSRYGAYSSLLLNLSGDLKQQTLELTSQVKGYGYNNAQVDIMATHQQKNLSINKLQFIDTDSASQLDLHGDITLLPSDITWQLFVQSTGFSLPKINMHSLAELGKNKQQVDLLLTNLPDSVTGRLQGNIATTGSWSDKKWSIALSDTNISGKVNNIDLIIKADIGINQSGHQQEGKLFIDFNNSKLTLQAANGTFWDINGKLTVGNIKHWYEGVNGAVTTDFSVTGDINNPKINLNSQFTELNWQHLYSNLLEIKAIYQPLSDHKTQFTLHNDHLTWVKEDKNFSVENLIFTVNGNANQHQIKANWLGDSTGQLTLTGHWNDVFTQWKSSIEKSRFTYLTAALQNDSVFDFNLDLTKQEGVIERHCWQGKGLNICLPQQAVIGQSGDISVNLNIDLSAIEELLFKKEVELISQVEGDIKVKWSTQQPIKANASFALSSGYLKISDDFSDHQLSQWSQGLFTFTIDEQQWTNKLQLSGIKNTPLLNIISTVSLVDDYPVKAKIVLNQFNLEPFQAVLTDVVNLEGELTADILIDGTLSAPSFNGDITLEKGKLQLRQNANTVDNISTTLTIKNNEATLDGNFFIEDKAANLQGNISWQDSVTMNINLTADDLPLVFPPELTMRVSPNLNFSLLEKSLTISGNIDVLKGRYTIEKLPESTVSLSDDVIIVDQYGQTVMRKSSGFDIKTNISVNIDKAFKVEGQGLQSHLFGQLQITQKEKHPFQLFGQIQSTDGTFEAYGQKLKIEKGELTFNGPIDNPYFNLRASRYIKAEDIEVGIEITGLADALDMQLFSSPSMEMPAMLSYLVRGRGLDAGTGNSSAAASLLVGFGITNSIGLFEQIEKIPLISNIAVDTEGDGDNTQATVSGYVGNRVYLKYGIGVYEPINELTVRMFLFNRFWLEIVSGIEQSSDLYYSFEID
ncbi:MAG: translocation and assembly module TamB [Colwellia sp.]|jgi:translocation and assembly module TamB